MKVRIHMNLHKKCFSISRYHKGKGWRVWAHCNEFLLRDVEFKVSQAGNMRARRTGVRNVHAYAYGHLAGECMVEDRDCLVKYNPFQYTQFVDPQENPVYGGEMVGFSLVNGVQVKGVRRVAVQ